MSGFTLTSGPEKYPAPTEITGPARVRSETLTPTPGSRDTPLADKVLPNVVAAVAVVGIFGWWLKTASRRRANRRSAGPN